MATASTIKLLPSQAANFRLPNLSQESADKVSELLQINHEKHHIFFNQSGFHNHIAHHLLTLFAIGADAGQIQRHYDDNASYQRPPVELSGRIVEDMSDYSSYKKYLGDEKYYHDFLIYFQKEIDKLGWKDTLHKHVFARDAHADDMLVRMFAGFLHPIIHLGFGIEFEQPAIIAEALAQAAVHDVWMGKLLLGAEAAASKQSGASKSLVEILEMCQADKTLCAAPRWSDGNKLRDGVIGRANDLMIKHASQYRVKAEELEERMAEMVNFCAYSTLAAQRPTKRVKLDFFLIHDLNCSVFFPSFIRADWLSAEDKIRLLEWKARGDLAQYIARGSPALDYSEITSYTPLSLREGGAGADGWTDVFQRICNHPDDGHASKVIRALAHGEQACGNVQGKDWKVQKGDWITMGHMAVDSVQGDDSDWVRSTGFDKAWDKVMDRKEFVAQL